MRFLPICFIRPVSVIKGFVIIIALRRNVLRFGGLRSSKICRKHICCRHFSRYYCGWPWGISSGVVSLGILFLVLTSRNTEQNINKPCKSNKPVLERRLHILFAQQKDRQRQRENADPSQYPKPCLSLLRRLLNLWGWLRGSNASACARRRPFSKLYPASSALSYLICWTSSSIRNVAPQYSQVAFLIVESTFREEPQWGHLVSISFIFDLRNNSTCWSALILLCYSLSSYSLRERENGKARLLP